MKLLLVGGPKFVGHALIEAALARGHEVTTFNRGQTNPDAFPELEKLHGDRETDVSRRSKAAPGTPCSTPPATSRTPSATRSRRSPPAATASSPRSRTTPTTASRASRRDPAEQLAGGPARRPAARGLRELRRAEGALRAGGRARVRRPGDPRPPRPDRRPERPDRPLHLLAAPGRARRADPRARRDQPVQMIDVRDLAGWMLTLVENERSGPYNATSPPGVHTLRLDARGCGADGRRLGDARSSSPSRASRAGATCPCWIPLDRRRACRASSSSRSTARSPPG